MRGVLPVGRLAGVPVAIHPLWFVVVALFVDERGRVVGIVTAADVAAVPRALRDDTLAASLAHRDAELMVSRAAGAIGLLESPAFMRLGRAVVVDRAGRPEGMVSVTDVERTLETRELLGAHPRAA